jgi:hypothetical protein
MDLDSPDYTKLLEGYSKFIVPTLQGRYLKEEDLLEVFKTISRKFKIKNEGHSEEGRIISSFRLGHGPHKILIWSQMHGNETTTTKSVLDLMSYFILNPKFSGSLFDSCSFVIIPVLNPDGAFNYTRVNANAVDLNRDAFLKTQSESRILQHIYKAFQPDVCFNMHDQRTIFSAGETAKPATVSFLSPSFNEERDINDIRKQSMSLISSANRLLQQFIPGQVGRYDDGFNINCIGDYFQKDGTPTVLFEAGHYPNDYEREQTRKYIFLSLLHMIIDVANQAEINSETDYFKIPENQKRFYDVILRNVQFEGKRVDIALQFKETLSQSRIEFVPVIEKIENLKSYFGHREIDIKHHALEDENQIDLRVGNVLATFKVNDNVFVI